MTEEQFGIVELYLKTNKHEVKQLNDLMSEYYSYYLYVLKYAKRQLKYLKRNRDRKRLLMQLKRWHIAKYKPTKEQKKYNNDQLKAITESYHIESGFSFRKWVYNLNKDLHKHLASDIRTQIVNQVWVGLETVLYGNGKKLGFTRFEDFTVVTATYTTPFKIFGNKFKIPKKKLSFTLAPFDDYRKEIFDNNEPRYIRLVQKQKKNHTDYAIQVTYKGSVPLNGRKVGYNESLGLDIGPSSYAYVTDSEARLGGLFPESDTYDQQIKALQIKMSRSDTMMNPDAFELTPKGHKYIKGHKLRHSNNWYKMKRELRYLYRLKSVARKIKFETMANTLIAHTGNIKMEKLSISGWQAGLFGKSIGNNAPSMLMEIIKRKLSYHDLEPMMINTNKAKLSQLHHDTGEVEKAQLSDRSKYIAGEHVQRDLYSAWLASHVTDDGFTVRNDIGELFNVFVELQADAIEHLYEYENVQLDSFGLKKTNFTTKSKLAIDRQVVA